MSYFGRHILLSKMVDICYKIIPEGRVLHGGQTSQYFVDVPLILQHPDYAISLMYQMQNLIDLYDLNKLSGFISPDVGGTIVAAAFQMYLIQEKQYNSTPLYRVSKSGKLEDIPVPIYGKRFLLIDDVITTGKALLPSIKSIQERGGIIDQAITVVNRSAETGFGDRSLAELGVATSSVFTLEEFIYGCAVKRVRERGNGGNSSNES